MNSAAPDTSRTHFAEIVRLQRAGERAVLVTPLSASGSVPLSAHSKLILRPDGSIFGTVGGGPLEARSIAAAREIMVSGDARVLDFDLTQSEAMEGGMICGGRCTVLVEPVPPDLGPEVFAALARAQAAGEPVVAITLLDPAGPPRKLALFPDGRLVGDLGEGSLPASLRQGAERALVSGQPTLVEEPVKAHLDPLLPRPTAYLFGAGHVAVPVAQVAALAGFRVVVVDDRAEFANSDRFPQAEEVVVAPMAEAFRRLPIGKDAFIVTLTRGHALDEEVVAEALRTPAAYIGMIGSKRKVASVLDRLAQRGYTERDLARVRAPVGLDIGADTVEEIAVSILAEMIAVRRGKG